MKVHGESDGITTLDNARRLVQHLKGSVLHVLRHTGHQVGPTSPVGQEGSTPKLETLCDRMGWNVMVDCVIPTCLVHR